MNCHVPKCGDECGSHVVCAYHRKNITDYMYDKLMIIWHDIVTFKGYDHKECLYKCFHCKKKLPREEVCGDHFPHTKGARPDLKFDTDNGVCCCKPCNTSGNPNRTPTK